MAMMDKSKLLAFSKKKANPPLAAPVLAAKRAQAKAMPPPAAPGAPGAMPPKPAMGAKPPMPGAKPAFPPKPAAMPGKPPLPNPQHNEAAEAPHEGEGEEKFIFELVEDAAQAAEASVDPELEQIIGSEPPQEGIDPPTWATDSAMWAEAAEAVGLGTEAADKYAEPFVVTCYLYKLIGGPIQGGDLPAVDESVTPEADMTKPGAAAKAIHARSAARPAPQQ